MRNTHLPAIFTLSFLLLGALAASGATAGFTPPAEQGTIYAVINADRSAGVRTTSIGVDWGPFTRNVGRANPYGNCAGLIAGYVLVIHHTKPDSNPFTLSTTGTIVRPPYQGIAPPEMGHACYKVEKMRARY
jgi:hypothetical protein